MLALTAFSINVDISDIDGILVTHEHIDHVKSLGTISKKYNIPVVTELTSIEQIKKYGNRIDIIQIGARNMYNYELLKEAGKLRVEGKDYIAKDGDIFFFRFNV